MTDERDDPYRVLGVPRGSTDASIASAYRSLARRYHPDIAGEDATDRMMRINVAFEAIKTADRRKARDGQRWHGRSENDGTGGAGPPPGRPSGSVLDFGRHLGWSIGEVARVDPGYLVWLLDRPEGRRHVAEIEAMLVRLGYRQPTPAASSGPQRGRRAYRRG
jgi:curved DNA-binding protein CbpA